MKVIQSLFSLISLLVVLIVSLLLVMLNPMIVEFDVFGLILIHQSVGLLVLFSFIVGIFFALCLTFIPSLVLAWRNKRLQKKIETKI